MAYTPTFNFANGAPLSGEDLETNFKQLREYLNSSVENDDISNDTIVTEDLQEGEYFGVTDDFIFSVSGNMYSNHYAAKESDPRERKWYSTTILSTDFKGLEDGTTRYISIPDCGKEFYLESSADVICTITFFTLNNDNNAGRRDWWDWAKNTGGGNNFNTSGWQNTFLLALDGVVQTGAGSAGVIDSVCYSFSEDGTGTGLHPNSLPGGIVANPQDGVNGCRRFGQITWKSQGVIGAGWHSLQLVTYPGVQRGYVSQFNLSVETFYRTGFITPTKETIGYNNEKPAKPF